MRSRMSLIYSASGFLYVPLPSSLAANITDEMNRAGASKFLPDLLTNRQAVEDRVDRVYDHSMAQQWADHQTITYATGHDAQAVFGERMRDEPTIGYVTKDLCPGTGDDIEHVPGTYRHTFHQYSMSNIRLTSSLSTSLWIPTVSCHVPSCAIEAKLTDSDFFSSPLPLPLPSSGDVLIDVVICDFALDDFSKPPPIPLPHAHSDRLLYSSSFDPFVL